LGKPKKNCLVFTPNEVVKKMLDILGYVEDLYGKKILENSCGEGNFLTEIVARYINDCKRKGFSSKKICDGLERDIYGFEFDEATYEKCIYNLNIVLKKYSLPSVNWNVHQEDALKVMHEQIYSFVVGNPPYISYSALPVDDREHIKESYAVCKDGKPDYYYAFIESAIKCLDEDGKLVYLVPNNFFKTKFAQKLRDYVRHTLLEIHDYTSNKIFDKFLTSSAIIVCDKSGYSAEVQYSDIANNKKMIIQKDKMVGRWIFEEAVSSNSNKSRFSDSFSVSSVVATLYNNAFIIKPESNEYSQVESEILRIAASPKCLAKSKVEYIIFPYYYDSGGVLKRYSEDNFITKFPKTVKHLRKFSDDLEQRNSDKTAAWFEYGRTQALAHLNQRKLLLSTVVTSRVRIYELDEQTIPYAGFYIIAKPGYSLTEAKKILESNDFLSYVRKVGVHTSGESIRISIQDINDFHYHK
jgi:methylase of polypeptide subunit release factors